MKNKLLLFFLTLFLLTGCSKVQVQVSDNIDLPELRQTAIEGKWTITKTIFTEENKLKNFSYRTYIGKDSIFSVHGVVVGNTYLKDPRFKIRKVNSDDYIKGKYGTSKEKLGIKSDYLYLVDIYDQDNLYFQVLREKDDLAYLDLNGVFVQMKKTSDQVTEKDVENFSRIQGFNKASEKKSNKNGLLLGIQYGDEQVESPHRYKTYFFKMSGGNLTDVEELDHLIIPREDGFYTVENHRLTEEGKKKDVIDFQRITDAKTRDENQPKYSSSIEDQAVYRSILYISPKYISLENYSPVSGEKTLALYTISSMDSHSRLSFSDLVEGGDELYKARAKYFLPPESIYNLDEKNFSLYRDQGIWKYKGRINFMLGKNYLHKDFPLTTLVSSDLSKYNHLPLPLSQIQSKLNKKFTDVIFSPNEQIFFGLEENKISVYNINNGQIEENPIREIYLPKNAKVIMTEWALGQFVDQWQLQMEKGVNNE